MKVISAIFEEPPTQIQKWNRIAHYHTPATQLTCSISYAKKTVIKLQVLCQLIISSAARSPQCSMSLWKYFWESRPHRRKQSSRLLLWHASTKPNKKKQIAWAWSVFKSFLFFSFACLFFWSMHWLVCASVADVPRLPSAAQSFVLSASSRSQFQFLPSVMAQRRHKLGTTFAQRILCLRRLCLELMSVSLIVNFSPVFTVKNKYFHYVLLIRAVKVNNNEFPCFHVHSFYTVLARL